MPLKSITALRGSGPIVMEGELYCLLDEGEVLLKAGDFLRSRLIPSGFN